MRQVGRTIIIKKIFCIGHVDTNGTNLSERSLEEGLNYIEALVGVDELAAAKGVLNELLVELDDEGTDTSNENA